MPTFIHRLTKQRLPFGYAVQECVSVKDVTFSRQKLAQSVALNYIDQQFDKTPPQSPFECGQAVQELGLASVLEGLKGDQLDLKRITGGWSEKLAVLREETDS